MNAKLCKKLRRRAYEIEFDRIAKEKVMPQPRKLMVHKAHEQGFRDGTRTRVTAVNHPLSWRGIYRWIKSEVKHGRVEA